MATSKDTKHRKSKADVRSFRCGGVRIKFHEEFPVVVGHTCSGEKTKGHSWVYRVTLTDSEYIDIAYMAWRTGEKDVRADAVESPSRALRRLEHGLRLGICEYSTKYDVVELRQARILSDSPKRWSNCFKASLSELRTGAGVDVIRTLQRAGGIDVDSKQELLGDYGAHRGFLCAVFKRDAQWLPVVAYVLTRVLPLIRGYTQED
jgi:hypothetical protein